MATKSWSLEPSKVEDLLPWSLRDKMLLVERENAGLLAGVVHSRLCLQQLLVEEAKLMKQLKMSSYSRVDDFSVENMALELMKEEESLEIEELEKNLVLSLAEVLALLVSLRSVCEKVCEKEESSSEEETLDLLELKRLAWETRELRDVTKRFGEEDLRGLSEDFEGLRRSLEDEEVFLAENCELLGQEELQLSHERSVESEEMEQKTCRRRGLGKLKTLRARLEEQEKTMLQSVEALHLEAEALQDVQELFERQKRMESLENLDENHDKIENFIENPSKFDSKAALLDALHAAEAEKEAEAQLRAERRRGAALAAALRRQREAKKTFSTQFEII